jgi:PhnB protein
MKLNTYLNFPGNCAEAMNFYVKHLGAKILHSMTFDQMPDPKNIPPGLEKGVLHASFTIGDGLLMASDGPPERVQSMRSAYLTLHMDSTEEVERIHNALSDGGEIFMPLGETFFAHSFAQLRDKFGINWMLIHEKPMR